jgi:hypothetical protein
MQRSSNRVGTLAAALAKAQAEITNPEKSLTATIELPFPRQGQRTFRYAPLSTGLDIIRKCLGQHEIATVQATAIDRDTGLIKLITTLVHASGEWVSSDWPVCLATETSAPHRMGAALTYARRYALFALVGIAGEDDLDAPDMRSAPAPAVDSPVHPGASKIRKPNGSVHRPAQPILAAGPSAVLRDQLVAEINALPDGDALALWAHRRLSAKNTLTAADARAVEASCQVLLGSAELNSLSESTLPANATDSYDPRPAERPEAEREVTLLRKEVRHRNKAHLVFVATQPCLICQRSPCDAHHLKFAQPRTLGRKVSDEFTVPLCREHHQELHRHGDERAWWANLQIDAIKQANAFWLATLRGGDVDGATAPPAPRCDKGAESSKTVGGANR